MSFLSVNVTKFPSVAAKQETNKKYSRRQVLKLALTDVSVDQSESIWGLEAGLVSGCLLTG